LSFELKRPVVEKTGLTGLYNYNLDVDSPDNLISALRDQLGLKLTAKKGPVEIVVIDHAEKTPTEN
jgi:uncharacterized protein (TIGR03435 family)